MIVLEYHFVCRHHDFPVLQAPGLDRVMQDRKLHS